MLDNFFNAIFGWAIAIDPKYIGVIIISFILTLIITLVYKYLTNQELMKSLKDEIKIIQKKMQEFKNNPKKLMELQKEAMEKNLKYMGQSMIPTLITFLPLIFIFSWLKNVYLDTQLNFLGLINNWIWVYIISSIVFSMILRKLLKVH